LVTLSGDIAATMLMAPGTEAVTSDFRAPATGLPASIGGYRILGELGRGGMGIVYRAEDPSLGRQVALKVLNPALAANPGGVDRFRREARAAGSLDHDHIVPIYQIGDDQGTLFLTMPLLRGEPLEARLARDGRLPTATVVRLGREIAAGLIVAHDAGLVHRDIKPANIWLEADTGRVKILDFGLARTMGDGHVTASGTIVGTPAFMAPEQAAGKPVDPRADLFSLGCILYAALTGRPPFDGVDVMAILHALANRTPPPVTAHDPSIPRALSDLIERLLSKDPADRPKSASTVAAALAAIERGQATGIHPLPKTAAPKRSSRGLIILAIVLVTLFCFGLPATTIFGWLFLRRSDDPSRTTAKISVDTTANVTDSRDPAIARQLLAVPGVAELEIIDQATGRPSRAAALMQLPAEPFIISAISLSGPTVTDETLARLPNLTRLRSVTLDDTRVTLNGLGTITTIPSLEELTIRDQRQDGSLAALIERLRPAANLRRLTIQGIDLNPASLFGLRDLPRIEALDVDSPLTVDETIHALARMKLSELTLRGPPRYTPPMLANLSHVHGLKVLTLHGPLPQGVGASLAKLPELERLTLACPSITDADLTMLSSLANLKQLNLVSGARVSDKGISDMKGQRPNCDITFKPSPKR
jgi:serine/threonine protein kinase